MVAAGLTRRFGRHTPVRDVDIAVNAGEIVALIGPNGGGKSTLLMLLAGLIHPTSGEVRVGGIAATAIAQQQVGSVGLITADPGLYPLLTGRENLRYFGGLLGMGAAAVDAAAAPLLEELAVADAMDRATSAYSSGMRQKVSLVRALLRTPKVLLLDEPTANLDPVATRALHGAVRSRADEGVAVVIATHDLHAAEHICDRVAVMDGTLLAVESLEGERALPATGRLFSLYASHVGASR